MPLSLIKAGETCNIQRIGGKKEHRLFLNTLGFVAGSAVTVESALSGNLIVLVQGSRVALSRELSNHIYV